MEDWLTVSKMAFSFLKKRIPYDILNNLFDSGMEPESFFTLPTKDILSVLKIQGDHDFDRLAREEALANARLEWQKIQKHNIKPLFILDEEYPERLREIYDAPTILYKLGEADLDPEYSIALVGTRKPTPYGIEFSKKLVKEIAGYFPDASIISGLAYGIDATAHKMALEKGLPTVAVVAHGLNMIYPAANKNLAKQIIRAGGAILSEYPFDVKPFRGNFLARNRIVAGLTDVTVVAESPVKGGAMSTANYAFMYNREVLALPGRISDEVSAGCNLLIRKNKAHLIGNVADLIEVTGWRPLNLNIDPRQRNLFPELEGEAKKIYDFIKSRMTPVSADEIVHSIGIPASKLLSALNDLEFEGIIVRHPGNRFSAS